MSDYQRIPGNIRSLLATKAQPWTDQTADLARQYAALCDETNQRLRRCADYLGHGMWSAAIHLADCQPNLLQAVTWLEFPERTAWADLCVAHGMPAPPVLEMERLAELKAAYDREKSLQPLLSRHRLLAIAKAPPSARLEVLRLLSAEDPNNPAWTIEILNLESARLDEISSEVAVAFRDRNDAAMRSLLDELTAPRWRHDVPATIKDGLQQAIGEQSAQSAQAELPTLAAEILSTFQNDPSSAKLSGLIEKWMQLKSTPGIAAPAGVDAQIQAVLDWHAAENRRKQELEAVKPYENLFQAGKVSPLLQGTPKHGTIISAMSGLLRFRKK
jgi:hypothetical protein